jgi:hypothetical protein
VDIEETNKKHKEIENYGNNIEWPGKERGKNRRNRQKGNKYSLLPASFYTPLPTILLAHIFTIHCDSLQPRSSVHSRFASFPFLPISPISISYYSFQDPLRNSLTITFNVMKTGL